MAIQNVNPTQGDYTQVGNVLTFDLGTIPAFGSVQITIDVTPNQNGQISDTVSAMSADIGDPDPTNNTVTNVTSVEPAVNLALSGSASPNPGTTNSPISYTVSVTNTTLAGTPISNATDVVVTDTLPGNIKTGPGDIVVSLSQGGYADQ